MSEAIKYALLFIGTFLLLLASIGILRMPDLFTRVSASTKASTLGIGCMLTAVAVHFGDPSVITRCILVIAFFFLTAPVGAHMVGRAAYFVGVSLWERTIIDQLRGRYDADTHILSSNLPEKVGDSRPE